MKVIAEKLGKLWKYNSRRERVVVITQGSSPAIVYSGGKVTDMFVTVKEERRFERKP